jgi:polyhydroxyalkanoate synthesis regulator phasin
MVRAAAGLRPFLSAEADELMQYAVRRGLINASEGEQVLQDVRGAEAAARKRAREEARAKKPVARRVAKKAAAKRTHKKKPAGRRR